MFGNCECPHARSVTAPGMQGCRRELSMHLTTAPPTTQTARATTRSSPSKVMSISSFRLQIVRNYSRTRWYVMHKKKFVLWSSLPIRSSQTSASFGKFSCFDDFCRGLFVLRYTDHYSSKKEGYLPNKAVSRAPKCLTVTSFLCRRNARKPPGRVRPGAFLRIPA